MSNAHMCPQCGGVGLDDGPSCDCGREPWTHCPVCRKPIAECLEDRKRGACSGPHIPDLRHLSTPDQEPVQVFVDDARTFVREEILNLRAGLPPTYRESVGQRAYLRLSTGARERLWRELWQEMGDG